MASVLLVVTGIIFALSIESIDEITKWVTFALYGGYAVPNILKWHWWRFNGYGYFAGMLGGVAAAIGFKVLNEAGVSAIPDMYSFFVTAPVAAVASIVVCLLTPPDDEEVLTSFYRDVRPWSFWRPILEKPRESDPDAKPNGDFGIDAFNVAIGIIWQLMLMVAPVCLVIRKWDTFCWSVGILAVTSIIMKFSWWNRLRELDD